jgi:RHS repeat-associated protein
LSCDGPLAVDWITYGYDDVGNRLTEASLEGTTSYAYDASDQLVEVAGPMGSNELSYDHNGNLHNVILYEGPPDLTLDGQSAIGVRRTFAFDQENRMIADGLNGLATHVYDYDGEGKRISAFDPTLPASIGTELNTTDYVWDTNGQLPQLVQESQNSETKREYIYGNDLISMTAAEQSFYYAYDRLGSVVGLTDQAGEQMWSYSYDPFGSTRLELRLDQDAPDNFMRFAGELFDAGTGLYHLRARQYAPSWGRFLQRDPAAPLLKDPYVASYVYANNQPTSLVDPSGRTPQNGSCALRRGLGSKVPSVEDSDADALCDGFKAVAIILMGEGMATMAEALEGAAATMGIGGILAVLFVCIVLLWASVMLLHELDEGCENGRM